MKALIFDSGALINLSMNGLLYLLEGLKKNFDGKFVITPEVKAETVDHPMGIQRFELGAIEVQDLINSGILEMSTSLGIDQNNVKKQTKLFMENANHSMQIKTTWLHLVDEGEISCIALAEELKKKGYETLIVIDERTTRMLCENPYNLEKIMSEKLHQNVLLVSEDIKIKGKSDFIRSAELLYVSYKKGLVKLNAKNTLEALLYAAKYKGCSISFDEIEILKKM